jgi:hypothetical protein
VGAGLVDREDRRGCALRVDDHGGIFLTF